MEGRELFIRFSKLIKEDFLSRFRSINLRDRLSETEIQLEWREVIACIILVLVSYILYLSVVLTRFCFVPLMILTIKRGWKEALVYLTGAFLLLMYAVFTSGIGLMPVDNTLFLFSVDSYAFQQIQNGFLLTGIRFLDYYFLFGMIGVFTGHLVLKNYKLDYVVFLSLCVYVGIFVFAVIAASAVSGFPGFIEGYERFVIEKTGRYVSLYLSQMDQYAPLFSSRGTDFARMASRIEVQAEYYVRALVFGVAPRGGYLVRQLVTVFIGVILSRFYFKRKLDRAAFSFSISRYTINPDWVWGLISSWGLVYINLYLKSAVLGILSWNMAAIFSILFFLKGLSILKIIADRLKIPKLIQYGVVAFTLFYALVVFIAVITGIGVANIWLKIDEKLLNNKSRREE
ncbi:MAG: DUF2232 domain-containing protein [Spirochaetes bacterium]|nr:DUF2232 domain-containing protein [Spirochaetota bacterium]